ncbi:MAG TPA: HAMP domain-containing sensor histidine kinase [Gemmatimonadales bacterium]|nr:HAMP domain-containing sensor histidine kinase [Gemmatimonadales bacterium]
MDRQDRWRRAGPAALIGAALLFGALSVADAWLVAAHFQDDARNTSRLFGRVFAGLSDPQPDAATGALLDLATEVRAMHLPMAVADATGHLTQIANAPAGIEQDSAALAAWVRGLDQVNDPITQPGIGTVHYGALPVARRLKLLALLQAGVLLCLIGLIWLANATQVGAARDRLWVAMARESAHQLGTPLMSLTGWIDYLRENPGTAGGELVEHFAADTERLQRVAKRFERIGRPARREPVGLGAAAERVVEYFRPRLPTLASPVQLVLQAIGPGPVIDGDPVLVEWAIEALVKNAVDALSGRGGRIDVRVEAVGKTGRVVVEDDGPGVAAHIRSGMFDPGRTTKTGGWGLGLALARRIVEQQHAGRVTYHPGTPGSRFVLDFPVP